MCDAIHWDQIDVCAAPAQELCQSRGIFWAVVDAVNHRHLKRGPSPSCTCMRCCGCNHFLYRPLTVEWHKQVA